MGIVSTARVALGGIAHKPWRAYAAEHRMIGGPATGGALAAAMDVEVETAQPLSNNAFKIPMVKSLVTQTLVGLADYRCPATTPRDDCPMGPDDPMRSLAAMAAQSCGPPGSHCSSPVGDLRVCRVPNVGFSAAIVNAVFHATGVRVRDLPVRADKLQALIDPALHA